MKNDSSAEPDRREFLRNVALLTGLASLPPVVGAAEKAAPVETDALPPGYLSFSPDEAAFVERLVDVMCPGDSLTPRGVECGLAVFIDRQLAGAYGKGERLYLQGPWRPGRPEDGYQLPLTPEKYFKSGVKLADEVCLKRHGHLFAELDPSLADVFLTELAAGKFPADRFSLADWFNDLVYPLFVQACFSDPVYGGNRDKVFWKMVGYPGLPAVNGLNMVKYRGKPFPGAHVSKSIQDFS